MSEPKTAEVKVARHIGQSLTVTDARGVVGPGLITEVDDDTGSFVVHLDWEHTDSSGDTVARYTWFFTASDAAQGGDYGLKLDFGSAMLPASPPAETGEAVAWRRRRDPSQRWTVMDTKEDAEDYARLGYEVRALVEAHPASDQSDTERMRAALEEISEGYARGGIEDLSGAVAIAAAALAEKAADK